MCLAHESKIVIEFPIIYLRQNILMSLMVNIIVQIVQLS
jgi:hypothetical protein